MTAIPYAEVIGNPIAHSKSPLIHGFWLERLGLEGRYQRTLVENDGLQAFLEERRHDANWRGCNVTIPHKQAVMPFLDRIDEAAARIGAVNTIRREADGMLVGYNTDGAGFLEPLRRHLGHHHLFRMARIIGSGGAARAIAHALAGEGFTIAIIARDTAKAHGLLAEVDPAAPPSMVAPLSDWAKATAFDWDDRGGVLDLVINSTSLGMQGFPPLDIDFSHIPPGAMVYDIVYAPLETPLLIEARRRGHICFDGLEMLVGQAAVAFKLLFGQSAPRAHDAELRAILTS